MCGLNVSELIAEAGLAMEYGATAEDVARTCHAHPVGIVGWNVMNRRYRKLLRRLAWRHMTRRSTSNFVVVVFVVKLSAESCKIHFSFTSICQ